MKKRVVFQFTVFDENTKELAKETAGEFEGVTKVAEVEGREGQLEVRGEFSSSGLKKELKKIDQSVESIKIRPLRPDVVKKPKVKLQQQGKGKEPDVKNIQRQDKGKEPEVKKIQQQDESKEPEVKTQQQDESKLPSNIHNPFWPSDVASSSNSRGVQAYGYLEKAIDVAKAAKDIGFGAAKQAKDMGGKAIGFGMEYYGKKNKEKEEAKAKQPIVGKRENCLKFPKAQKGRMTGVFEAIIKNEEEKGERRRKQAEAMMKQHAEEMEQKNIREEKMKKQGVEKKCGCIIL